MGHRLVALPSGSRITHLTSTFPTWQRPYATRKGKRKAGGLTVMRSPLASRIILATSSLLSNSCANRGRTFSICMEIKSIVDGPFGMAMGTPLAGIINVGSSTPAAVAATKPADTPRKKRLLTLRVARAHSFTSCVGPSFLWQRSQRGSRKLNMLKIVALLRRWTRSVRRWQLR